MGKHFGIRDSLNELMQLEEKPLTLRLSSMGKNYNRLTKTLLYNTCKRTLFADTQYYLVKDKHMYIKYIIFSIIRTLEQKKIALSLVSTGLLKDKRVRKHLREPNAPSATSPYIPSKL